MLAATSAYSGDQLERRSAFPHPGSLFPTCVSHSPAAMQLVMQARPAGAASAAPRAPAARGSRHIAPRRAPLARRTLAAQVSGSSRFSARGVPRRPLWCTLSHMFIAWSRLQESGVETAEAASQEDHQVVPMADSLVERAKLVVETNFVDEAFAVRCHGAAGVRSGVGAGSGSSTDSAAASLRASAPAPPCFPCRQTLCQSWRLS